MLVLSRKPNESIIVDGKIRIVVLEVRGRQIRLGIEAPSDVGIIRAELVVQAAGATPPRPHGPRR